MKKAIIIEWLFFIVCVAALLMAAKYSDRFVPTSFGKESIKTSVVEPRENMYGAAQVGDRFVWICGQNGKIVRSIDAGKTWKNLDAGDPQHLQDIAAWDEHRLVAVGNDGVVIISRDGGESWARVEVPKSKVDNKLIRVKTYSNGNAWTCGILGTALSTDDYGATWVRRIPEQDITYNDIAFATPDIGVIVCEFGKIKRTEDGGDTWTEIVTPVGKSLVAVDFNEQGIGVVVGSEGTVLRTVDFGLTWQLIDAGTSEHFFNIMHYNGHWVIVGNKGIIATSSDSGVSWRSKKLSDTELLWHTGIIRLSSSKMIIVGGTQGIYENENWKYLF